MEFRTHTGEIITGPRLQTALNAVAQDWADLAHAIRKEDAYASHVTTEQKDAYLAEDLAIAEKIKTHGAKNFTIAQRINEKLTGECVGFMS